MKAILELQIDREQQLRFALEYLLAEYAKHIERIADLESERVNLLRSLTTAVENNIAQAKRIKQLQADKVELPAMLAWLADIIITDYQVHGSTIIATDEQLAQEARELAAKHEAIG